MSDSAYSLAIGAITGVDNFLEKREEAAEELLKRKRDMTDKIEYEKWKNRYLNSPDAQKDKVIGDLIHKNYFMQYGGPEADAKIEFNKGAALEDLNRGRGDEPISIFSHQLGTYITVPRREAYKIEEGQLEAIKNNTLSGLDKTNMRGVLSEKYGHAKAYLYSTKQISIDDLNNADFIPNENQLNSYKDFLGRQDATEQTSKNNALITDLGTESMLALKEEFGNVLQTEVDTYEQTYGTKDIRFNNAQLRQLLQDKEDALKGKVKIQLSPPEYVQFKSSASQNPNDFFKFGMMNINEKYPYFMLNTPRSIMSDMKITNMSTATAIGVGRVFFDQFKMFSKDNMSGFSEATQGSIRSTFENGLAELLTSINYIDKGEKGQQRRRITWANIGMNFEALPEDFQRLAEQRIGQPVVSGNKKLAVKTGISASNKKGGATSVITDVSQVPDAILKTEFAQKYTGATKQDVMNAVANAAMIKYNKPLSELTEDDINRTLARHKIPTFNDGDDILRASPLNLVGAALFGDVFYNGNPTTPIDMDAITPNLESDYRTQLIKAMSYGKFRSGRMMVLKNNGMDHDPYLSRKFTSDMLAKSMSLGALKMVVNPELYSGEILQSEEAPLTVEEWQKKNLPASLVEQAQEALTQSDQAYSTGNLYLTNLKALPISGRAPEGIITFVDNLRGLGAIAKFGFKAIFDSLNTGKAPVDMNQEFNQLVGSLEGGMKDTYQKILQEEYTVDGKTYKGFQSYEDGLNLTTDITRLDKAAQELATRKMLHAALVFYTAAAFQGEGGKAISDGDRKFVEWALSYDTFTNVNQRIAAVKGMMKIIARARDVNRLLVSNDPRENYIGLNYNKFYGENTIEEADWPEQLRGPVNWRGNTALALQNQVNQNVEPNQPFDKKSLLRGEEDVVEKAQNSAKYSEFRDQTLGIVDKIIDGESVTDSQQDLLIYYKSTYKDLYDKMLDDPDLIENNQTLRQQLEGI